MSDVGGRALIIYGCLDNHYECRNSHYFKEYLFNLHGVEDYSSLDNKAVAGSFEKATRIVFDFFNEDLYDDKRRFNDDFQNSKFRKLVDISTDYFMGSIMCNYYKNDFHCYDGEESWGFEIYDPLPYPDSEEVNIASPIPVYNSKIEIIGTQLIHRIDIPEDKDDKWHHDNSITERNLINLIQPILVNNEEWVMLAGTLSPTERIQNEVIWKDVYMLYCCTSGDKHLTGKGDRYLTIEIPEYIGNLNYYYMCSGTPETCKNIRNITTTDEFDDSTLVLPPADFIKHFNLTPNYRDMSWVDQNGKPIILCDNCKKSYYRSHAKELVLIRKESLDEYLRVGVLKQFAFTERLIKDKGFSEESCFHYELQDGKITRKYRNNPKGDDAFEPIGTDEDCNNCPYGFYEIKKKLKVEAANHQSHLMKFFKEYAPSDLAD